MSFPQGDLASPVLELQTDLHDRENMQTNRSKVGTLTWQRHRIGRTARNCDQCPPRHPAIWILHQRGVPPMYLCIAHAERMAKTYELERPPRI